MSKTEKGKLSCQDINVNGKFPLGYNNGIKSIWKNI